MQPRVLVIEDTPAIAETIRDALQFEGYTVEVAWGPGVLEAARTFAPDVILLDLYMPGDDSGESVYAQIRADPALCDIPVCVSSAVPEAGIVADALGAEGKLLKPWNLVLLHDEMKKLVEMSYQRRHAQDEGTA